MEPALLHRRTLIHAHVTINHERVSQHIRWGALRCSFTAADDPDTRVVCLNRGELLGQRRDTAPSLELERLLDEALLLEV